MIAAACFASVLLTQVAQTAQTAPVAPAGRPFALMVGDLAPPLAPSRWLKGEPIESFQPGVVYLVEFWATWCVPCKRSIPHLAELQARHADKLRVIGVDVWEPRVEEVEPFVQQMGDKIGYTIALDDVPPAPPDCDNESQWSAEHGVISNAWLAASGWKDEGIPTAFVVDGSGHVAWIGDPLDLDEPLARILKGDWPLADAARDYRVRRENVVRAAPIRVRMREAERGGDRAAAVACIDEILAISGTQFADLAARKVRLLLEQGQAEQAAACAQQVLEGLAHDNAGALGQIGHVIAFSATEPGAQALAAGLAVTQRANDLAHGERADILDTLARLQFLQGQPAAAVKTERLAIEKSKEADETEEFASRLKEYEAAAG